MGKRSRDVSFSPSGDEAASDLTKPSTEPEDLRSTKILAYDNVPVPAENIIMQCSLPPHSASQGFTTLEEFELHYAKEHTNRCVECNTNLPSAHFLSLHLDENHNPLREALAAKGEKTYACFVPGCEKKCSTPQKRRLHLIDKHNFPKVYNFRIVNDGINNTHTLLQDGRRRRISITNDQSSSYRRRITGSANAQGEIGLVASGRVAQTKVEPSRAMSEQERKADNSIPEPGVTRASTIGNIEDLEDAFAALRFVPRSVSSKQGKTFP